MRAPATALLTLLLVAPPLLADLRQDIDHQVRAGRRHVPTLGVHVVELASGEEVYAFEADRSLVPASNQKLLTTVAALDLLGAGYRFRTELGYRGVLDPGGGLLGDLAVRGGGDPTISGRFERGDPYALFRRWAAALREHGIERVAGDLYLEHGLFDDQRVHPDWPADQRMWWYEAPVDALSFNDNCMLLSAWGASRPGRPALVELLPRLPLLEVKSRLVTTAHRSRHRWKVHRDPGSPIVQVDGQVYAPAHPFRSAVTIDDPVEYFGRALSDALAAEGIDLRGELRPVERLPGPYWWRVAVHERPLVDVLDVTNKRSQNFYAESLFKLLGARVCGRGSWPGGVEAVEGYLRSRMGWDLDGIRIADGSGMSRANRIAARRLTELLREAWFAPEGLELVRSLPYGGEDGASLHERLDAPPYRGNVFAKTGTLTEISTLSGFAKGRSGRIYVFSILCNGAPAWRGRQLQDRIVETIVDGG